MKRTAALAVCVVALLAFSASSAQAVGPLNFYIRGGIVGPSDFSFNPIFGLAGANIDLNLGAVSLSPECDILLNFYSFSFDPIIILPGAMLNFNLGPLYIGPGAIIPLMIGSGYTIDAGVWFKANAGLKLGGFKLQAFVITPLSDFFGITLIGATLGTGF